MRGGSALVAAYAAAVIACVAAPVIGFIFNRRGRTMLGLCVAWTPRADALLALTVPPKLLSS
jgi:hypothetical protein